MKHFQVHFISENVSVDVPDGTSLLEAAGHAGIVMSTPCGGAGRCGKCKAVLLPSGKEVLACKYQVSHNIDVEIPPESRFFTEQILQHSITHTLQPSLAVQKIVVEIHSSNIDSLVLNLSEKLKSPVNVDETKIEILTGQIHQMSGQQVTTVLHPHEENGITSYQLTGIEQGNTCEVLYGLAVDAGTTTLAARLINLITGQIVAASGAANPQHLFGADVVSRISYCQNSCASTELQNAMTSGINGLIEKTTSAAQIDFHDIYEIVVVGNTTMNHLFLGYPVVQLGQAPYAPHSLKSTNCPPASLNIKINPSGNVHTMANIAGFVGSDTLAAALACGLDITDYKTLVVDIGTNGEIVLKNDAHLLTTSCAAGPALEGAGITYGSRAQDGAIERVQLSDDDIDISIIGNKTAQTICGSGLIDAIAVMLECGVVDSTGRLCPPQELNPLLPSAIKRRLIKHKSEIAFALTDPQSPKPVVLTQKDVRQFQLAKAAIKAGIMSLLNQSGIDINSIDQLFLAGAFGSYLDRESAIKTGLLPNIKPEKIHYAGNAAGAGAEMVLINKEVRKAANMLAEKIEYVEIANKKDFSEIFSDCLIFPEN